jgi:hypothetical protein
MEGLLDFGYVVFVALLAKVGHRFKRPNVPAAVPSAKAKEEPRPESLKLTRFSRSRPSELEAIAELLWFGDEKHKRGEMIFWDELPTIRNNRGVECLVIVRTIHFLPFLGEHEELRRRNAIVLDVPQPNA